MAGLIPIADLPTRLSIDDALQAAHQDDLDWIEDKLSKRMNVLVECEKQLVLSIYRLLRDQLRQRSNDLVLRLIGGPSDEEGPQSLIGNTIIQLQEAIFSGEANLCLVVPHLDVAVTTTQSGLSDRAREVVAMIYENPDVCLLAFKDPSFEIPKAIENVFAAKRQITGIPRDQLPKLLTQTEARKFGVEEFNPFALYKYVSGLNVLRFREILEYLSNRLDFNPDDEGQTNLLYREIRDMTILGGMSIPEVDLDNDIGGYEPVKEKIKEEILELLRYKASLTDPKDIREIEEIVPKGMLFVGPPGTGKTFFAKAMACALDATVSIVSGPELKSKWVGESLPYDEELFVTINGEARRIEIGNLVENYSDQEVGCWTYKEDGTGCFRPVTAFLEHEGPDYVDVLITETGREVRVTGGHSVFVNREGLLTEVLAEEVVPEETRIAVPLRIKSPQTTTEINLFRLFNGRRDIHVSGYEELLQEALKRKEDLTIAFDRCTPNTAPVARLANWKRKPQVSLGALQDCLEQAGMGRFEHDVKMHCWQRGKEFPSRIPLTEDFGEFLGIWIAKGDYNKNCVRITVNERQVTHYQTLCEKLFGHVTKYEDDRDATLILSSALLQRLMEKGLSMHTGAHYKRVPSIVWTAPEPFIQAFLRGYFSGDGTFNKKTIEATTVSRGLADDIMCLLQYVGIAARCKTRQEWNGTTSYRVRFTWSTFLRTFVEKVGFCEENRNEEILNYVDNLKLKRALQTPEQHISNDILWDKIVGRRRIPYDGQHVYDISVQGTERFLAGFGNVLVHNSEGNLREVFSKARKSAPSIIVFDEIDSFATTRGTYSGSGVEHSMVNQLLTEMDGFRKEELVFVVGTTNFPESLDPALLRPGRFEMQIEIPYPDDKDREAILQIYRDKFKLDLSKELLDFLVQKTSGFSDAKSGVRFSGDHLYAICRSLKREAIRRSWKGNKKSEITKEDCIKSLSKKDGKKFDLQEKEERAIAIHEAGHAIIAHFCPNSSGIERISVATDSEDILGFVLRSQGENKYVRTKGELLDDICICMGGRVAEALFLDDVSIGCANDLQKATEVARIMVEELGMSDEVGLQVYTSSMGHAHTRGERRQMSASAAEKLDSEIGKILTLQHERAQEIIEQYKGKLEELVGALVEKKTLYKKEIEELLKIEKTVDPKSKKKGKTKK